MSVAFQDFSILKYKYVVFSIYFKGISVDVLILSID